MQTTTIFLSPHKYKNINTLILEVMRGGGGSVWMILFGLPMLRTRHSSTLLASVVLPLSSFASAFTTPYTTSKNVYYSPSRRFFLGRSCWKIDPSSSSPASSSYPSYNSKNSSQGGAIRSNADSTTTTTTMSPTYWNREEYATRSFPTDTPITKEARIVALASPGDPSNLPLDNLPTGAKLLAVGTTLDEFDLDMLQKEMANVIYVSASPVRETLAAMMHALDSSLEWIHARSAGIDHIMSNTIRNSSDQVQITNVKGAFSSTLAEYTMMACAYFAKDLPRLLRNNRSKDWNKYSVLELRGATMGIVGYGDIGRATAKLAKVYGMRVIALRRNPNKAAEDPYCDVVYGNDKESLNRLFSESDYIVCSAPLTDETKGMIGKEQFDSAKKDAVFINVGRGPIVNEDELIAALKDGRLKGAGLDVVAIEPLPRESELWTLDNVLLSP